MDRNSPFTVDRLKPQRVGGGPTETYALTSDSTSPIAIVGRDSYGRPVEQTVPTCYSKLFVGLDGGIKDVPLRTASVFSMEPEAERYEILTMREIIGAGQFPLDACPYTGEYRHIVGGTLIPVPKGEEACDGSKSVVRNESGQIVSGGCEHMQALIYRRIAASRAETDQIQKQHGAMSEAQAERLLKLAGEAFGEAMKGASSPKPPRDKLKADVP